jgi:nicotinamide mononucleotide transporter
LPQVLIIIEILSVLGTIIYIYLAAKKKAVAWIFGIVASILGAWLFFERNLAGSGLLNVVYAILGVIGYVNWNKYISEKQPAYGLKWYHHVFWIITCVLVSLLLTEVFAFFLVEDVLYQDMLLATFCILATLLEIRKDTSTWWYWMVCNTAYSALYAWQSVKTGESLYFYSALMFGLAIFSYYGLRAWTKPVKS